MEELNNNRILANELIERYNQFKNNYILELEEISKNTFDIKIVDNGYNILLDNIYLDEVNKQKNNKNRYLEKMKLPKKYFMKDNIINFINNQNIDDKLIIYKEELLGMFGISEGTNSVYIVYCNNEYIIVIDYDYSTYKYIISLTNLLYILNKIIN